MPAPGSVLPPYRFLTKIIAEAAGAVALSATLYFLRLYTFTAGGSITPASMVPVLLLSFRRGVRVGVLAGIVLGLVVLIMETFVVHPIQLLLDYPLAFGALGVAGLFRNRPMLGVIIGIGSRFASHFISGLVFFTTFNLDGVVYSAVYNGSYLVPEFIICTVVIQILVQRKALYLYL